MKIEKVGEKRNVTQPNYLSLTLKLFVSLFLSASQRQNGVSIVVHSFMNSMEPPGSADMSQMANILWGRAGAPTDVGNHGVCAGCSRCLASGMVINLGLLTAQQMPFTITEAQGAIFLLNVDMYLKRRKFGVIVDWSINFKNLLMCKTTTIGIKKQTGLLFLWKCLHILQLCIELISTHSKQLISLLKSLNKQFFFRFVRYNSFLRGSYINGKMRIFAFFSKLKKV